MPIFAIVFSRPRAQRVDVRGARLGGVRRPEQAAPIERVDRVDRDVGVHRLGPERDQLGGVGDLARLAGLRDEPDARPRLLARSRWWWTAATASSEGMGTEAASAARSLTMRTVAPAATCTEAAAQRRSSAAASPDGALGAWERRAKGRRREALLGDVAQRLHVLVREDGWGRSSRCAWAGPCSSRLPPAPSVVASVITRASRIGSIGGLVTWAKSCLK